MSSYSQPLKALKKMYNFKTHRGKMNDKNNPKEGKREKQKS